MNGKLRVGVAGPVRTSARDLMALVGGGRRLEVLLALSEGEQPAGALAARLRMRPPHVSQSLAALMSCGLVEGRHDGTHRFYHLTEAAHVGRRRNELVMVLAGTDHTRVIVELHDGAGAAEVDAVLDYVRQVTSFSPEVLRLNGRGTGEDEEVDERVWRGAASLQNRDGAKPRAAGRWSK